MTDPKQLWAAAFTDGPIATIVVSADDRVLVANRAAEWLFGPRLDGGRLEGSRLEGSRLGDSRLEGRRLIELPVEGLEVHRMPIESLPTGAPPAVSVLQFVDVSERLERERELTYRANHDPLTGLLNRTGVDAALRALLAAEHDPSRPGAVFFCDLNGFKQVNDEHGHLMGDQVVKTVAQRIAHTVRRSDGVGRFGGDEFVVVLPEVGLEDAERTAARVVQSVQEPVVVGGSTATVGICVGAVVLDGKSTVTDVIGEADDAMYQAKRQGGAERYVVRRLG